MSCDILSKLKEDKRSLEKTLESMEKYTSTDSFVMSLEEEKDLFHEHFEAIINLREVIESRIDYMEN